MRRILILNITSNSKDMNSTVKFIILGLLLFGGFFFLINSEYAEAAKNDTVQKVVAGLLFGAFVAGVFYASKTKK